MTHVHLSLHDLSQLVLMQTQSGKTPDEIVKVLVARGWPEASALRFVSMTLAEHPELGAHSDKDEREARPSNPAIDAQRQLWRMFLIVILLAAAILVCSLTLLAH